MKSLKLLLIPLALAGMVGCSPKLRVNVLQPAPVNLGASKQLTVVESTGRRSAREKVVGELIRQARGDGYFTVTDRSEEGISVKVAGRNVTVSGGQGQGQAPNEIGMKIDILEWTANSESIPEQRDAKGKVTQEAATLWKGKVLLGVTAFDAQGKAFLAETEYAGSSEKFKTEEEAAAVAGATAVRNLLNMITPRYVQRDIRLDDEDEGQKPIIEVAKGGNLDRASTELKAYLETHPQNPAALYNLAAMLDAQGRYEEALELYNQAISQSTKDFYVQMKSECAQRLANQQALAQ
ncbi:MAG: tetratricopeptide repeat protein [Myxococcaceae bacterium]|nr:tetratricopeptide repeat protein [Myxococcaceae bacterium]